MGLLELVEVVVTTVVTMAAGIAGGDTIGGYVSAYDHGPTVGTLQYRISIGDLQGDLSQFETFVAVADCGRVGHTGWLEVEGGDVLRVIAFDCAGPDAAEWMDSGPYVAEVDYWTWQRHPEIVHRWAWLTWDS